MRFKDLTGNRYGKLVVLEVLYKDANGVYYWKCKCDCGNIHKVARSALQQGKTKSCGCYAQECRVLNNTTHGMSKKKIYKVWSEMVNRATNPKHQNAEHYFDKSITVCDEWKVFENFYRDMGDCPNGLWLERIDNTLGYFKENCKWESPSRQCSNRGRKDNKSGRLGVYWKDSANGWAAVIKVDKKRIDLGVFNSFASADAAIEKAELEYLGYSRKGFV